MKESFFCGYTIGTDAYKNIGEVCMPLGKNVLVLGGETALKKTRNKLNDGLKDFCIIDEIVYGKECFAENIKAIFEKYKYKNADFVIGVGGGKAIDTAKGVAHLLNVPVVTAPTIASNCAASSAMSVVYTKDHVFEGFWHYKKPAYHCFINTEVISNAPYKYIRAGIGDTLAKFYEVEFSSRNAKKTYSDEMAISISRMCNTPLFSNAKEAIDDCKSKKITDALSNTARIILISTGMVSMLVNEKYNGAVSHALFYGLTNIKGFEEKFLHGDVIGYTTIVQLVLDKKIDEAKKLKAFLENIEIKTTLKECGIIPKRDEFEAVLCGAMADPDMEVIPYEITKDMLYNAISDTENL